MPRVPLMLFGALVLCLGLGGCYADQKKQLAACEASAAHGSDGEPLRSIQSCMGKAGYDFVGYANPDGLTVVCDLPAVIRGQASADGSDAKCFQPKSKLGLYLYHMEMPVKNPT